MSMNTMGEDVQGPAKPMHQRPWFVFLAVLVALVLIGMSGRYAWLRWKK